MPRSQLNRHLRLVHPAAPGHGARLTTPLRTRNARTMSGVEEARRAWPGIHVSDEDFARYVGGRSNAPAERVAELYLACACANGDEAALRAFEAAYFAEVDFALRRLRNVAIDQSEARQLVRERLFLPDASGARRIASWSGTGALRTWVRVLATRVLLDRLRQQPREVPLEDALLEAPSDQTDAELQLIKERFRPQLRAAMAEAIGRLDARQRLLLRCELEGRSLNDVARLYQVNLRSVQRWLCDARDALLAELRAAIEQRVPDEADSLLRLMRSQIASSIAALAAD